MQCPVCKIEMTRERENKWVCRNPRCAGKKKGEKKDGAK